MTDCTNEPALVWDPKDPDDAEVFFVDFEKSCSRKWKAFTDFAAGARIRVYLPGKSAGFEYEWSSGRTGGRPPSFPETIAAAVADGSGTWTCRAISTASLLKTISGTPTWTADSGVTAASPQINGVIANATLSGGVDNNDYTVLVKATFSDATSKTAVCILPVRRATRTCDC